MIAAACGVPGETAFIHPNADAYWRNILVAVWNYRLGGYQVLKKWLSLHESKVLNRQSFGGNPKFLQ